MGDIVNLNRARKKKRAADEKKTAEENRARFGRTKTEKKIALVDQKLMNKKLDQSKRDEFDSD